jgi:hypothetical protein
VLLPSGVVQYPRFINPELQYNKLKSVKRFP